MAEKKFRGQFDTRLDPKGRMSLPTSYGLQNQELILTNNWVNGRRCLDVYTIEQWETLENSLEKYGVFDPKLQKFKRFYMAAGQVVTCDSQGRIVIPQKLRAYCEVGQDVTLVGMGKSFEVWDTQIWKEMQSELMTHFDETVLEMANHG